MPLDERSSIFLAVKLDQLETFVVVAEELHFRRAAERLFTQPSSVSNKIARLEAEYGTPLFIRDSRNVTLSPAGEALVVKAREVLAGVEQLERMARDLAEPGRVRVVVGVMDEGLAELAETVRKNFIARYPNAEVPSNAIDYHDLGPALDEGRVDLQVTGIADAWFDPDRVVNTPLFAESRLAVLPLSHPCAESSSVSWEQLVDTPFVAINGLPKAMHDFYMLGDRRDLVRSPDVPVDAVHMHNLLNAVARGDGIFTVSHGTKRYYPRPDIAYVPVSNIEPSILFVTRRIDDERPHVLAYIDECIKAVRTSLDLIPAATSMIPLPE